MQIGLIHPSTPQAEGSGASHSATQIANALIDKNHEVTVFTRNNSQDDFAFETRPLDITDSKLKSTVTQYNSIIEKRKSELSDFDIVHSYLMRTIPSISRLNTKTIVTLNAYGAICPRNDLQYKGRTKCESRGSIKCRVCTANQAINLPKRETDSHIYHSARTAFHFWKRQKKYKIAQACISNKDEINAYHALSNKVKERYSEFGYDEGHISVIPNIFDNRFDVEHKSDFDSPYRLLYVAALKRRKGADLLPQVMRELDRRGIDAKLTVAGKGYMSPEIKSNVKKYGLKDKVDLKGHVPYEVLPELYATHDLFIYPARWDEPFGRVFLEAMGAGIPILSTDIGDVKSIVGDGGKVVRSGAPVDFAAAIEAMLEAEDLKRYSKEGKSRIRQFSASQVANEFLNVYLKLL